MELFYRCKTPPRLSNLGVVIILFLYKNLVFYKLLCSINDDIFNVYFILHYMNLVKDCKKAKKCENSHVITDKGKGFKDTLKI